MEDTGRDSGKLNQEEIDKLEHAIKQKQIGAVRIYDGALSPEFCDELVEVFEKNEEHHETLEDERIRCIQYAYSKHHQDEKIHQELKEHIMSLYEHYLADLNLPNMIAQKGLESFKIRKYTTDEEDRVDPHIDVVNHDSAIRAVGFLFYLEDNDAMTNFPRQGIGAQSIKGRVVIYPPHWEYPIIEKMPSKGVKYNMQTYLHYA